MAARTCPTNSMRWMTVLLALSWPAAGQPPSPATRCDHNGERVIVDFQNDHQPDFQSMELKSDDDCDRLVVKRLDRLLRAGASGGQQ